MVKHGRNRKFNRKTDERAALLRGLANSLILKEGIKTTLARAKELRPYVEKLVTHAKKEDTLTARRLVTSKLISPIASAKLVKEIGVKYKDRAGGYTRITKLPTRISDASKMAKIEFV